MGNDEDVMTPIQKVLSLILNVCPPPEAHIDAQPLPVDAQPLPVAFVDALTK